MFSWQPGHVVSREGKATNLVAQLCNLGRGYENTHPTPQKNHSPHPSPSAPRWATKEGMLCMSRAGQVGGTKGKTERSAPGLGELKAEKANSGIPDLGPLCNPRPGFHGANPFQRHETIDDISPCSRFRSTLSV